MKNAKKLVLAGLLASALAGAATVSHAGACTHVFRSQYMGATKAGSTDVVIDPFTQTCSGGMHGEITLDGGGNKLWLQIEKEINGTWTVMTKGSSISYPGEPGRYRFTINNYASMGVARWTLKYSKMM